MRREEGRRGKEVTDFRSFVEAYWENAWSMALGVTILVLRVLLYVANKQPVDK
jgi:hypothetical protein